MNTFRVLMLVGLSLVGCTKPNEASCVDDFCNNPALPFCDVDGTLAGTPDTCIAVDCEPGAFVACRGDEAITCRASGADYDVVSCPLGCDDSSGCIETACEVGTTRCGAGTLERCNELGEYVSEACPAGCVEAPEPHCAYLEPQYLPDVCDVPALEVDSRLDLLELGDYLNTDAVQVCTGGVVTQTDGAPDICVVRYRTIRVPAGVEVRVEGARVLALVADDLVDIAGTLDVSANGQTNGAGAGVFLSGGVAHASGGGGGGGASVGASGGRASTPNGGPVFDPDPVFVLRGGAHHPMSTLVGGSLMNGEQAGGSGGATTAIACRGSVQVSGMVDAGGGGGHKGDAIKNFGGGGGSGGFVALQGLQISVSGRLYSNGGWGGDGKPSVPSENQFDGNDAARSSTYGNMFRVFHDGGLGGRGALLSTIAERGGDGATGRAGGGGGAMGTLVSFTPSGVAPALTPSDASPRFSEPREAGLR